MVAKGNSPHPGRGLRRVALHIADAKYEPLGEALARLLADA